uniref:Collagen type XII alpha 1 chain n=1 Tax=Gadus morhua TaxID=8049 RepID=A0A8C5FWC9_GADMO
MPRLKIKVLIWCLLWFNILFISLLLFAVDPPSDLKFKILNENTVQMSWTSPSSSITGYRLQVISNTDEPSRDYSLPYTSTQTSISDLTPDVDYSVSINSYHGSEESINIFGQLTIQSSNTSGRVKKPQTDAIKCSVSALTDLVFLVDGSWSVGRENFKHIRSFIGAMAGAFEIGEDKTRVGIVQYSSDTRTEFPLTRYTRRGDLLNAISTLPYKGGNTMTGDAIEYLLNNTFTEAAGARKAFPKVAMIITDGKSQDPVEEHAKRLRNIGVEIFVLGIKGADEDELKEMGSTPHSKHVYNVPNFDLIKEVQKKIIMEVCAGVDDQLNSLVSGEEMVEPASNLQVTEIASKSMRITWDLSVGDVSGYKLTLTPMLPGMKRQELYTGATQSNINVRDLSPETEYEISLYALKGLVPSEPVMAMEKTQPVKVSTECSLGVDVQADVVILVDGSYSIGLKNFAKVRAFLEVLVNSFDVGAHKVQLSLVQYSRDPHTEFALNTHHDINAVVKAVRAFPYRGGSTNTGKAMTYVRERIFIQSRGARQNVPRVMVLITDGKSSDSFKDPATKLRNTDVEIFAVGVKDAVRSELEAIANPPSASHVFEVEDFDAFQRISKELTQSICLRIEQELLNIKKRSLLPPQDLVFSEVTSRSFRTSWTAATTSALSYLVRFRKAEDNTGDYISLAVPADTTTAVLPHLFPLTTYEVNVFAQYEKGDSFPLTGEETTLEEQGTVRDLEVTEETTDSFRVSWQAAPGSVIRYHLTYVPRSGVGELLQTMTSGPETTIVLQELLPITTYQVSVSAEYSAGTGQANQVDGTTKEGEAPQHALKISLHSFFYNVLVDKSILRGSPRDLQLGSPKDLVTSDVTDTSFAVRWTAAPGNVRQYRLRWKSMFSDETGEKMVGGDTTDTVLEGLTPETLYQVSVFAAYGRGEGEPLVGEETTDVSAAGKMIVVSEETEKSMKVDWQPAPGNVVNYRVTYRPRQGGRQLAAKVPGGGATTTVLRRLTPLTTYDITVIPVYRAGEGKAREGDGTTLSPYKGPRNLQTSEPGKTSFRVTWDHAPGDVKGYKVTFHPSGDDIDLGELQVGPYDNTVVLEELRSGTKYSVSVFGMFDGGESMPLAGEEKTTLSDASMERMPHFSPSRCKTKAQADIVILVDGSWSIGRLNFKTIRAFIARMVGVFDIGSERVQIGLAQYSGDPKTEWHLNAHDNRDSLLEAIANLPYKGGNTMTGLALNYILQNNFKDNVGMRTKARKIGVLVTDGKSQDDIIANSANLRDQGIELYAIGVKNADENELRSIASDPDDIHMYNVKDFSFLLDIVDRVTDNLCNSVKGSGDAPEAPTDLVTSEVTHYSFRATWMAPSSPVEKFRVEYVDVSGRPQQVFVDGSQNTVVLQSLNPLTEYQVSVYSVIGEESSEPLRGAETTPPSGKLRVRDVTHSTLWLDWDAAPGPVIKYLVTYQPDNGEAKELEVDGGVTTRQLDNLISQTEYAIAVTPVYAEGPAEPMLGEAITDVVPAPKNLRFSEVTQTSFKAHWDHGAPDVALYRIGWSKKGDSEPKFAILNSDETTHLLENLEPDTPYVVSVTAIYPDESESEDLLGTERTLSPDPPTNLVVFDETTTTLNARWNPAGGRVQNYKITYVPTAGGRSQTTQVGGKKTTVLLPKLTPNTEYSITVAAVYARGAGGELTEPLGGVRNLRVTDPTTSTLNVNWEAAEGNVRQYKIYYVPAAGGVEETAQVPGSTYNTVLKNLDSGTLYTVTLVPIFSNGEGQRMSEDGKTLERSAVKNIHVFNPTTNTLSVRWEAALGPVQQYRVVYTPSTGGPSESVLVPGGTTETMLQQLLPNTPYNVGVVPLYEDGEGPAASDVGTTLPRSAPRNMRVYDPTTSTLSVSWEHALGPVVQYVITYAPTTGDPIEEHVSTPPPPPPLFGMLGPRNLQVSDEWYTRFRVSWDPAPSKVNGYKLVYQPEDLYGRWLEHGINDGTKCVIVLFLSVYLNVTDLTTYNVGYDSFCIRWAPHRAATSYRLEVKPFDPSNGGAQVTTVQGSARDYCFKGLTPDALYNATVYTQTTNMEGPGVSVKERTLVRTTVAPTEPPTPPPPPTIPSALDVCNGAKADLVFLIDGSWSIGDESFNKVIQFVFSMTGAFDVISAKGMQVSFVQYSDDAKTEFKLNSYHDKGMVLSALHMVRYRGGNTKTGVALKHVYEKVFNTEGGMRRNVPKVLVVVTDGRSQDEVKKEAEKLQHSGYSVFVVGVADVDQTELRNIGSKPSERHVFVVDDFDAFAKIQDNLITFICETATSTCPLIYMNGFTTPGFRMLEAFNITDKTFAGMNGVSMETGSFNSFIAYRLHKDSFISQPTKEIHPEGLPPAYTIILLFRLLPDTPTEAFDIWQIADRNNNPEVGVTVNPSSKTITFYNKDTRGEIQKTVFNDPKVKEVFHGSFHKLHISISPEKVKLNVDCQEVAEKPIKAANNITLEGYEVLGKMSKSGGGKKQSATFQLQMFDIVCSLSWTTRDKCCDLPATREEAKCPALPHSCTCTQDSIGPQGPSGPSVKTLPPGGFGPRGEAGPAGPLGPPGPQGPNGLSLPGEPVSHGSAGIKGEKGDRGDFASQNMMRSIARQVCEQLVNSQMSRINQMLNQIPSGYRSSSSGPPGPAGPPGNEGSRGEPGQTGRPGFPGTPGLPGNNGEPGLAGEKGERGNPGTGTRGQRGGNGPPGPPGESRTGPPGPSGTAGPRGPPGRQGASGVRGPPGPPGYCDSSQCVGIPYNGQGYTGTAGSTL